MVYIKLSHENETCNVNAYFYCEWSKNKDAFYNKFFVIHAFFDRIVCCFILEKHEAGENNNSYYEIPHLPQQFFWIHKTYL